MDDVFSRAYELAQQRFPGLAWALLEPKMRAEAVYCEMRRLDAEAACAAAGRHPSNREARPVPSYRHQTGRRARL
jgi:hypothetical protein